MAGPLAGLSVIELAALGPAPSCAMMLGDMGAEVIRIDRPGPLDLGIDMAERFDLRGRNKRSLALDLKAPAGAAVLRRLIAGADVLIEGFRPGVAERLGVGPEACLALRPSLVYARATGWGQDGPLAQHAGHDINYIALAGALSMIGPSGGDPVVPSNLLGDYAGGAAYLAFGIVCAVLEARGSGRGQVIDGAIIDGVAGLLTMAHGLRQADAGLAGPSADLLNGSAPFYTTYRTSDGLHMAVGALEERFYRNFLTHLDLNPDSVPARADRANWPALRALFAARFEQRTRAAWTEHFASAPDACVSPVLTLAEAPDHPHNLTRGMMAWCDGAQHPLPAPRLSRTPGSIQSAPPGRGDDTRAILAEIGMSESEIAKGLREGAFMAAGPDE